MPDVFTSPEEQPKAQENHLPISPAQTEEQTHPVHMFSTFTQYPQGIRVNNQEPNEKVILFLRRHFITNLSWITGTILLTATPVLIGYIIHTTNIPFTLLSNRFIFLILIFYYLIVLSYAFVNFINWFYNIGIVTNRRVLDIDFTNLSSINVAATSVKEIEDVTYTQQGFTQQFYNFGDVKMQTATKTEDFIFEKTPKPAEVVNIVSQLLGGGGE